MTRNLTVTERQADTLVGLVTVAANIEAARYRRMVGRPVGSHKTADIAAAQRSALELAELENSLMAQLEPEPEPDRWPAGTLGARLEDERRNG